MRIAILAALAAASSLAAPVLAEDAAIGLTPEQIGQIFCLSRTGSDPAAIAGLLSPELSAAIAEAARADAEWAAANPGEKPPLGDGIPWQAWPDYTPDCNVGLALLMKTEAKVEIGYDFPDTPHAEFTDTLLLTRVAADPLSPPVWRIDNIAYDTGGDLRTTLREAFAP